MEWCNMHLVPLGLNRFAPITVNRLLCCAAVSLQLLSSGCSLFEPQGCDAYAGPMITVKVIDTRTDKPVLSPLVVVFYSTAQGDSIVVALPSGAPNGVTINENDRGGWGSGVYAVEVRGEGFKDWRRNRVEVGGGCHPHERITAKLVPR